MENTHIPAWKRIAIKKENNQQNDDFSTEDPLNVTTHLSTGSLTKKEKKRIINKDLDIGKTKNKVSKNKKDKKKLKLSREDRLQKRNTVLKDQLRYLIDFSKSKPPYKIPQEVLDLESVKTNYVMDTDDSVKDENKVVEVWKFAKSKQNWIIKHFFSEEEIPLAYNDILIEYLYDLKGRAKMDLKQKCEEQIKAWENYLAAEEEKIKAMVEGDSEDKKETTKEDGNEEKDSLTKETSDHKEQSETEKDTKKEEEKEVVPPNKRIVERCEKLLSRWATSEDDE